MDRSGSNIAGGAVVAGDDEMKRALRPVPVTEEIYKFRKVPFALVTDEIERLRLTEAEYQRENDALDRVQRALVGAHPGNLVILSGMPPGSWARLPEGWQSCRELSVTPQWPPIPLDIKGPVAVAKDLAKEMIGDQVSRG